jgi:hypothetical protein
MLVLPAGDPTQNRARDHALRCGGQSQRLDAANRTLIAARSQFAATDQRGRRFVAALDKIEAALHAAAA